MRDVIDTARALWRHPNATPAQLVAFQDRKLRRLVRHAYAHVGFYRRAFEEAGVGPADIRSGADLPALPITTKQSLRAAPPEDTRARGLRIGRLIDHLTSGSTGQPFRITRSTLEEDLLSLFRIRARRQFGLRARDRTVVIAEPPLGRDTDTLAARLVHAARLYRVETADCRRPTDHIVRQLQDAAPDVIGGYPSALAQVASRVGRGPSPGIRPRLVTAGGEALPLVTRRRIEEGFQAPLFDIYGAHECNVVAWQCPQLGHLHVCDDNVIVEVLRDGAPVAAGESGEVVITALHSLTMPFVRYSLGDVAVRGPAPCPCGQPFSTLGSVHGRVVDYFHLVDGRSIHPFAITGPLLLADRGWIDRHQLVQESPERVVLRIAPLRPPQPAELDRLRELGERTLGPQTRFRVEVVDDLAPAPGSGGKFQSYRSLPATAAR